MESLNLSRIILLACVQSLVIYVLHVRFQRRKGPPRLPLIGNLHQIPKTGAHRQFTEWSRLYGGLFTLKLGPVTAAVITDRRLVRELIDKKSSIYSTRPASYVSHDLITRGDHLLVMKYGDTWRSFRKIIHQNIMESMCDKEHVKLVEAEQAQMMRDFLLSPEKHMLHPKRMSNSIVMSLLYGLRTGSCEVSHFTELYDLMERWSEVMETGATPPVDFFPFLKLLPESLFNNWVQRSLNVGQRMKRLYSETRAKVLARRQVHGSQNSLMDRILDQQDKLQFTDNELDFIGGVMMEGGSDTVSTMLLVIIQALTLNPDVQKHAQAQIDAVCGQDRSPTWDDYDKLPYVSMIVKEAMRWRPVTPLAFPHALSEDDVVDGTVLPKGTTVFINVWGLHHDETVFPDPGRFDPSRYQGRTRPAAEYASSSNYMNRDHYIYGSGRRICPGIHLAEREMFLGTAKLLWGFNFQQQRDTNGQLIPIDTDPVSGYTEGFLVSPKPFACSVTPRSKVREEVITREFGNAEKGVLAKYQ